LKGIEVVPAEEVFMNGQIECVRISALVVALGLVACGPGSRGGCPSALQGHPDPTRSGIKWGGDTTRVSAQIADVAVECILVSGSSDEANGVSAGTTKTVQISATATVTYAIEDQKWFDDVRRYSGLESTAVFEAVSASGVVLGNTRAEFHLVSGGTSGTVSATISGLAPEVAARVAAIRVKWDYGG
jgi:hypothetical protein